MMKEGAQSAAPATKPDSKKKKDQGSVAMTPAQYEEKAKGAPAHKGAEPAHGDHPSRGPQSMGLPFEASHMNLDGHPLKKK